jgi:tRNA (guanine26-N2/guanine27-N2)-dimethyltransferase
MKLKVDKMQNVIEGKAKIKVYKDVFYNPKMSQLRDISCLLLNAINQKGKLIDANAATGIRGIRYAIESGIDDITFVDNNLKACRNTIANANANNIKFNVICNDFQKFANISISKFDFIDLDPFGSPTPFIYDSLKLAKDKTILMVTATDTPVLCGAEYSACMRAYFSRPMHNELCHENGVRILLSYIARNASQFNFGIEPILSIADMHYMRVFLRINKGSINSTESIKKIGFIDYCDNCHNFKILKGNPTSDAKCDFCNKSMNRYGPIWIGLINNKNIVKQMIDKGKGLKEHSSLLLHSIYNEPESPFFYHMPKITKYLKKGSISNEKVINALKERGYKAGVSSFDNSGIKTNAGIKEIIDITKIL